jgi:hypothetical protein
MQFGAALIAIYGREPELILTAMHQARGACRHSDPPGSNLALQAAAFLSCAIAGHRSYLAFLTTPSLRSYSQRLGQLLGGSLAREGRGLIPLAEMQPRDASAIESEAVFVALSYAADKDPEMEETLAQLRANHTPFLHLEIQEPLQLLTVSFQWEVTTILTCARLGFDPFHVSDNRVPLSFVTEILEEIARGQSPLQRSARLTDQLIQLYVDGNTRQAMSTLSLEEALRTFLRIPTANM